MPQTVSAHMTLSLDGFGTGENQTREHPFGAALGESLHRWMFEDGENNRAEMDAILDYGAFVMGRNMYAAPGSGPWEQDWTGWWGNNPPYHAPVFVLTHHARAPAEMKGGTVFHFVTDGLESALRQAKEAAGSRNVAIAGGVSTLRNFLNLGLVDDLHLQLAPILAHRGERLWDGLTAKLEPTGARSTKFATHLDFKVVK